MQPSTVHMEDHAPKVYYIPANYLDEAMWFRGMVRRRNCIEAGLATLLVFFLLHSVTSKLQVISFGCSISFLLFIIGVQGESLSQFLYKVWQWKTRKGVILYNPNATPLMKSPLEASYETTATQEALIKVQSVIRDKLNDREKETVYIEGETFRFEEDKSLKKIRLPEQQKEREEEHEKSEETPEIEVQDREEEEIISLDLSIPKETYEEINLTQEAELSDMIVISKDENLLQTR